MCVCGGGGGGGGEGGGLFLCFYSLSSEVKAKLIDMTFRLVLQCYIVHCVSMLMDLAVNSLVILQL